jgi:SAM-dependent methyltransferase
LTWAWSLVKVLGCRRIDRRRHRLADSRTWWNQAARHDAEWYIATAPEPFFERGRRDVDELVAFCGLQPSKAKVLLEIGCGAGRMTRRFAELYGQVVALDVSDEMLRQGQASLADHDNVGWVLGSGADLNAIGDGSVDDVFSYITLQHLPDRAAVLRYLQDAGRVLRPGGQGALQVRRPGLLAWAIDLVGHLAHAAQGRRVWSKAWRGTRVSAGALLAAAERSGVGAELRSRGRRHLWVLLWSTESRDPVPSGSPPPNATLRPIPKTP